MSHTVVMEFAVDDKGALIAAAVALGLRYNEGQHTFKRYAGKDSGVDDAISVPDNKNAYEIGIKAKTDGRGYDLLWDNFSGGYGLCDFVGQDGERLQQEYAAQVTMKQYELDGFSVSRSLAEDGRILMEATRL